MKQLYIFDCAAGKLKRTEQFPVSLGNSQECTCALNMDPGLAGVVMLVGGVCTLFPKGEYVLNGERRRNSFQLEAGRSYTIAMNRGMFVLTYYPEATASEQQKMQGILPDNWYYYDTVSNAWQGPFDKARLLYTASAFPPDTWVTMDAMFGGTCTMREFAAMAQRFSPGMPPPMPTEASAFVPEPQAPAPMPAAPEPEPSRPPIDEEKGKFICPSCWLHFDAGDVMSIASHPDLMGDDMLGSDAMKRFFAVRFNARGQALDEKGVPCQDVACPHCRHKLPPHFLKIRQHIFSIIGAPSAGKSYYLASLIHEMGGAIAQQFGISWRDADPAGNSMINDACRRLFSAPTPEQAYLSKTDLEGALYEEFYRHGRMAKLPKPFIFNISGTEPRAVPESIVFYDNAGEHFEPGRNSEDSPGAGHVAVASGLFFLFDPTTSPSFRESIVHTQDPQCNTETPQLDQQDIIMAETEARINSILNLELGQRIHTPLAIMIGKCDLWEESLSRYFPGRALLPATGGGKLLRANVEANSALLRQFLLRFHPALCRTAESLSDNVRYFAISQLGCSPVTFKDPLMGVEKIGPDPKTLAPRYVCDPTLWVLSQISPKLIHTA